MRRDGTLGLLSLAAGGLDALSFLALGVFTSAMTGNAALLGIALGQDRLGDASRSVVAFAGFALGVTVGSAAEKMRPRLVLLMEAGLLAALAALWPEQVRSIHQPMALSPNSLPILTLLGATAMGIQAAVARRLNAPAINTIVFTTTLTAIVSALTAAALGRAPRGIETKTWRQIAAFLLYMAGAAALAALAVYDLPLAAAPAFGCVSLAALLVDD